MHVKSQHVRLVSFNKIIIENAVTSEVVIYFPNFSLGNHGIFFDSIIFASGYSSAAPP